MIASAYERGETETNETSPRTFHSRRLKSQNRAKNVSRLMRLVPILQFQMETGTFRSSKWGLDKIYDSFGKVLASVKIILVVTSLMEVLFVFDFSS